MRFAPEEPSVQKLNELHPLSAQAKQKVFEKRQEIARAMRLGHKLLAIVGPCAMTDDQEAILEENRRITAFGQEHGVVVAHRLPPWKPRTDPDAWHGLETSDPVAAHRTTVAVAEQSGNLAMEFGAFSHVQRYLAQTAIGWRGSRNEGDSELLDELTILNPFMPVIVKNGMDGDIQWALNEVDFANGQRKEIKAAPVMLGFRGGESFDTQSKWTRQYFDVWLATNSGFIVDTAHGSEQAHDPTGRYEKSQKAQMLCLLNVVMQAESIGLLPRGVMVEASNINSPTDPVLPLEETFEVLARLAAAHKRMRELKR